MIRRRGPCHIDAVEFATLAWVDWFNTRRLLSSYIPPAEYEERYYEQATVAYRSPTFPVRFTLLRPGCAWSEASSAGFLGS